MRIQTLGLVHRHLYESENLKTVDLKTFLSELCQLLQDGSGAPYWRVRVDLDIAPVSLQIERAIPLGLLVTELATNSFKHAFPSGRIGTIGVKLTLEDGTVLLTVADDGVGTPPPQGEVVRRGRGSAGGGSSTPPDAAAAARRPTRGAAGARWPTPPRGERHRAAAFPPTPPGADDGPGWKKEQAREHTPDPHSLR